jgi:hypothetical protein
MDRHTPASQAHSFSDDPMEQWQQKSASDLLPYEECLHAPIQKIAVFQTRPYSPRLYRPWGILLEVREASDRCSLTAESRALQGCPTCPYGSVYAHPLLSSSFSEQDAGAAFLKDEMIG